MMNSQSSQSAKDAQIRIAKRLAAGVGTVVALIFIVTGVMGWIYFNTGQPVREFFQPQSEAEPR